MHHPPSFWQDKLSIHSSSRKVQLLLWKRINFLPFLMGTDLIVPIELTDCSLKANHRMQVRISLRFIFKKSKVLLLPDQSSGEKKFPLLECQYILYRYLFFIKISALFLYICRVFFLKDIMSFRLQEHHIVWNLVVLLKSLERCIS